MATKPQEVYLESAFVNSKDNKKFVTVTPRVRSDLQDKPKEETNITYAGSYPINESYKDADGKTKKSHNTVMTIDAFNKLAEKAGSDMKLRSNQKDGQLLGKDTDQLTFRGGFQGYDTDHKPVNFKNSAYTQIALNSVEPTKAPEFDRAANDERRRADRKAYLDSKNANKGAEKNHTAEKSAEAVAAEMDV